MCAQTILSLWFGICVGHMTGRHGYPWFEISVVYVLWIKCMIYIVNVEEILCMFYSFIEAKDSKGSYLLM